MPEVNERIEQLEGTIERIQTGLDHVQRALSTADKTQKTAHHVFATLRRAVIAVALASIVFVGVNELRRRLL